MNRSIAANPPVHIKRSASESFQTRLAQAGDSLCVSTYQTGKVAMVGWDGRTEHDSKNENFRTLEFNN